MQSCVDGSLLDANTYVTASKDLTSASDGGLLLRHAVTPTRPRQILLPSRRGGTEHDWDTSVSRRGHDGPRCLLLMLKATVHPMPLSVSWNQCVMRSITLREQTWRDAALVLTATRFVRLCNVMYCCKTSTVSRVEIQIFLCTVKRDFFTITTTFTAKKQRSTEKLT